MSRYTERISRRLLSQSSEFILSIYPSAAGDNLCSSRKCISTLVRHKWYRNSSGRQGALGRSEKEFARSPFKRPVCMWLTHWRGAHEKPHYVHHSPNVPRGSTAPSEVEHPYHSRLLLTKI